jgi:phenylalanine-4-hydroxylase
MAVGAQATSVFGGPADREKYGELVDFAVKRIPAKSYGPQALREQAAYADIRRAREAASRGALDEALVSALAARLAADAPDAWLARLELVELGERVARGERSEGQSRPPWADRAREELRALRARRPEATFQIEDGLAIAAAP